MSDSLPNADSMVSFSMKGGKESDPYLPFSLLFLIYSKHARTNDY